jgi:hypothetical protein
MPKTKKETVEIELPSKAIRIQNAGCPNGHSLMDKEHTINGYDSVSVLVKYKGEQGLIYLDPVYGSFKNVFEIKVEGGGIVEFFCPHCRVSLIDEHQLCSICSSPMFALHLPHGGIIEGCSRNGCQFHTLKLVSGDELVKRLYESHTLDAYL